MKPGACSKSLRCRSVAAAWRRITERARSRGTRSTFIRAVIKTHRDVAPAGAGVILRARPPLKKTAAGGAMSRRFARQDCHRDRGRVGHWPRLCSGIRGRGREHRCLRCQRPRGRGDDRDNPGQRREGCIRAYRRVASSRLHRHGRAGPEPFRSTRRRLQQCRHQHPGCPDRRSRRGAVGPHRRHQPYRGLPVHEGRDSCHAAGAAAAA